jgi:hypothetical protein
MKAQGSVEQGEWDLRSTERHVPKTAAIRGRPDDAGRNNTLELADYESEKLHNALEFSVATRGAADNWPTGQDRAWSSGLAGGNCKTARKLL